MLLQNVNITVAANIQSLFSDDSHLGNVQAFTPTTPYYYA